MKIKTVGLIAATIGLAWFSLGCRRDRIICGGDTIVAPSPVPRDTGLTGVWTGQYTLTDHKGCKRTYLLTLDIQHNPNTNDDRLGGNWNNGTDSIPLIGSSSTLFQVIGSFTGTNPFRHYSYTVRPTLDGANKMILAVQGNDFHGAEMGDGEVVR